MALPERGAAHERYASEAAYHLEPGAQAGTTGSTPVLMLHGLGGDSTQLMPCAGPDPRRLRLAPDLRAHGRTSLVGADGALTFAGLAGDLAALLGRLRFPAAVVVGVSMGAGVAARLALCYPARVVALVLIRPAWLDSPAPANLIPLIQAGRLLRRAGPEAGLARFIESGEYKHVAGQSAAAAASLAAQFRAPCAVERSARLTRIPYSTPFRSVRALGGVGVPSVVIGTPGDPQHPFAMAEIWAAAIPGSRLASVPPRDSDPAGYTAGLRDVTSQFVADIDAGRQSRHDR